MKEEFKLDNQLCFRLYIASRLMTQAYHPLLSEYVLTYPQKLVLLVLWAADAQPAHDRAHKRYLETTRVELLLQRMEKEGILIRQRGQKDARQMIVSLTRKGWDLQKKLADVPFKVGGAVFCDSVTPETAPTLYKMLNDIISKLKND